MDTCLSIYLGKELNVQNMVMSDIWTKGCLCLGCLDNIYLVERGNSRFLSHCPRKEEYKLVCEYRSDSQHSKEVLTKRSIRKANDTVEMFHRYFTQIVSSFLCNIDIYKHRKECLEVKAVDTKMARMALMWKTNQSELSVYALQLINCLKSGKDMFLEPNQAKSIKKLFSKTQSAKNHTFSVLCIIKYLSQNRARIHLEALFLYLNYLQYYYYAIGESGYPSDNEDINFKSTFFYMINIIIFCPWTALAERISRGEDVSDLQTKVLPYFDLPPEILKDCFGSKVY